VFAQNPLGPSSITATGLVVGMDHLLGRTVQMRSEAVFPDYAHASPVAAGGNRGFLTVMIGLPKGASSCVGLQFDGPGFTENVVIQWSGSGL
jgi:hypothetical protein